LILQFWLPLLLPSGFFSVSVQVITEEELDDTDLAELACRKTRSRDSSARRGRLFRVIELRSRSDRRAIAMDAGCAPRT
jgi:hypothetical protein